MKEFNSLEKDGLTKGELLHTCLYQQFKNSNNPLYTAKLITGIIYDYAVTESQINYKRYKHRKNYFESIDKWLRENEPELQHLFDTACLLLNMSKPKKQ